MSNVDEKLAKLLTADTTELIPYLPYLLQDLWELGSSRIDINDNELVDTNRYNQECIIKRANEMKRIHPEKSELFEQYILGQQAECDELEGEITGVTWLFQVI